MYSQEEPHWGAVVDDKGRLTVQGLLGRLEVTGVVMMFGDLWPTCKELDK